MEKRVEKLETAVTGIDRKLSSISADFKYMAEKIEGYLDTHDKVIRLDERIKTANKRILESETINKDQQKEITSIKVKYASISAIVSLSMSILTTLIFNLIK